MDSPYARVVISPETAHGASAHGSLAHAPTVHVPRVYNAAVDFIDRHITEGRGSKLAYLEEGRLTTYAELAERTLRCAAAIRGLGVLPEQRVMLCLHDTADFPAIFFGALRAGAVAVPVNTLLTTEEYAFMLADSRARVLFVSDALTDKIGPALAKLAKAPRVVVVKSPAAGSDAAAGGMFRALPGGPGETRVSRTAAYLDFEAVLEASNTTDEVAPTTSDDVAFWLYSSGSTGAPKGALHLHSHLVQTAALYGRGVLGIREDDVVFSAAKLFFAYGLGNAMTFPLHVGATAVTWPSAQRPPPSCACS